MNVCACCGRHLRKKGHYCGVRCKSAALSTASGYEKAARNKHYALLRQAQPRLTPPTRGLTT